MSVVNVILFLIYLYGLGYSLTRFERFLSAEITVMRLGIGLGAFPVLGVLLNFFHILIDWRIFLVFSLSLPVFDLFRWARSGPLWPKFTITAANIRWPFFILLGIFIFSLICYCYGPFTYPWLASDDSWYHAASIKYISTERQINIPSGVFQYINPYPPGYDLLIAVMHQTANSLSWTMKFFNGLIISLGVIFFYFFAKQLMGNKTKALIATFFLASIPCYLSHYIWSHSLIVTLIFPAFYLVLKAKDDRRYILAAGVVVGGILVTQPTQPIKFAILYLLLLSAIYLVERRVDQRLIIIPIIGGMLALAWYGPVIRQYRHKELKFVSASGTVEFKKSRTATRFMSGLFSPQGGATTKKHKIYHYLFPPQRNDRNNPVGVGVVLSFFILLGILGCAHLIRKGSTHEKVYALTSLFWLIFTFLGCNTKTFSFPFGLFAYRFWALFAIASSLVAAQAVYECMDLMNKGVKTIFLTAVIAGVLWTSAYPKFITNTYIWHYGSFWSSPREIQGYLWLRFHLKPNTKVFAFTQNLFVIGHDMRSDYWTSRYQQSFKDSFYMRPAVFRERLKKNDFEYIIIGEREIQKFGRRFIYEKVRSIKASGLFQLVYELKDSVWIFKVL